MILIATRVHYPAVTEWCDGLSAATTLDGCAFCKLSESDWRSLLCVMETKHISDPWTVYKAMDLNGLTIGYLARFPMRVQKASILSGHFAFPSRVCY